MDPVCDPAILELTLPWITKLLQNMLINFLHNLGDKQTRAVTIFCQ